MLQIFFAFLFFVSTALGQSLMLKAQLDPRDTAIPDGFKLWAQVEAQKYLEKPLRETILTNASLFLDGRVSVSDFVQLLNSWGNEGFSKQERLILIDTIEKSSLSPSEKNRWLCRLDSQRNCKRLQIFPDHLAPILQKYEFLVVDGLVYPYQTWSEIQITDDSMNWIFLSSRFETYRFNGKWTELKLKSPTLEDWVTGQCSDYLVKSEVQAFDHHVLLDRRCLKPSIPALVEEQSFLEKHKNSLWIAAGVAVGLGALGALSGQKIILEKPSFK